MRSCTRTCTMRSVGVTCRRTAPTPPSRAGRVRTARLGSSINEPSRRCAKLNKSRWKWICRKNQVMRLALFGGTFDPIHKAHLTVAHEAAGQFHLDEVWFIPAAHPPHKSDQSGAPYEDRFRMTEFACQADPRFVASRLEEGESKSYSLETVERVRALGEQPYFII